MYDKERERCVALSHEREDFVMDIDGYYVYWPDAGQVVGSLTAYHLRWLADELDRMNKPWNEEMNRAFVQMDAD